MDAIFPPSGVMYGLRPFDGMGYAHMWIPDQVRDDSGTGVLFITTVVETEYAYYRVYQVRQTVIPDLIP